MVTGVNTKQYLTFTRVFVYCNNIATCRMMDSRTMGKLGGAVPTYRLRKVRRRLEEMGAIFTDQAGRKHGTVKYRGRVARWPNQHDDPIDDTLLNALLRELGIPRRDYFDRGK